MITRAHALMLRKLIERASVSLSDEDALSGVELYPAWLADTAYQIGDRVRDGETLYKCVQSHTSQSDWRPGDTPALWTRVSIDEWPEWVQPTGAQDAYQTGDKVTYLERHWISIVDDNVWPPDVYGWQEA